MAVKVAKRSMRASSQYQAGKFGPKGEPAAALIAKIERGFPYRAVEEFRKLTALPMDTVADLIRVPSRTLNRRKQEGRLHPDESERLLRVARVVEKAVDLFEKDTTAAVRWLKAPQPALSGETPLNYSRTDVGAREVEDLIGRLEHGVFS